MCLHGKVMEPLTAAGASAIMPLFAGQGRGLSMAKLIDGTKIAAEIREEVAR